MEAQAALAEEARMTVIRLRRQVARLTAVVLLAAVVFLIGAAILLVAYVIGQEHDIISK
jgi:VIT1/CCC1 family predicted Fe2+/Mn2+ transporter